jgi:hypothetical protein
MIIGGAITTAVGAAMFATGVDQYAEARQPRPREVATNDVQMGGETFMVLGGLHLAVGAPLLLYGLLSPRDVYVRDSVAVALDLSVDRRHVAGAMTFAF